MLQRSVFLATCAFTLAASGGGLAAAAPAGGPNQVEIRVSSDGLDLTTQAGADQFLQRLYRAATIACGTTPDASPLVANPVRKFEFCRANAIADAIDQSRAPLIRRQVPSVRQNPARRMAAR